MNGNEEAVHDRYPPGWVGDRSSCRRAQEEEEEDRAGKRVRMDPDAVATLEGQQKVEEAHIRRHEELEKEKEIIRKKLEANRARRRSSAAHGGPRKSLGRPRPSVLRMIIFSCSVSFLMRLKFL